MTIAAIIKKNHPNCKTIGCYNMFEIIYKSEKIAVNDFIKNIKLNYEDLPDRVAEFVDIISLKVNTIPEIYDLVKKE